MCVVKFRTLFYLNEVLLETVLEYLKEKGHKHHPPVEPPERTQPHLLVRELKPVVTRLPFYGGLVHQVQRPGKSELHKFFKEVRTSLSTDNLDRCLCPFLS